jgi:hypothetical protein
VAVAAVAWIVLGAAAAECAVGAELLITELAGTAEVFILLAAVVAALLFVCGWLL